MARALCAHLILDRRFIKLKLLLRQIAQRLDGSYLLQLCQRRFAFASSLVIFGISQTALFVAAGDHDLRALQTDRRVFKFHRCGVEENRVVFFPHRDRELIHDAAVYAVKIVLRKLPDQRQILIRHLKTVHIPQDVSGQHLNRRRRGQPGTIRNVAKQQQIHTVCHFHPFFAKRPHHALWIVRPVRFLLRPEPLDARLDHAQMLKIHGIKTQNLIVSLSCHAISTDRQRAGEYMTAVIVGMFSDQIHTPRRKINLRSVRPSENLPKFL